MKYSFDLAEYKKFLSGLTADEWHLFFSIDKTESISKYNFRRMFEKYKEKKMDAFDEAFKEAEEDWQEDVIERFYQLLNSQKNASISLLVKGNEILNLEIKYKTYTVARTPWQHNNLSFKNRNKNKQFNIKES